MKNPKIVLAISPVNFLKDDYSLLNYWDDFFLWYVNETNNKETEINNKRWYRYSNFNLSDKKHINILKNINKYKKKMWKKINLVLNSVWLLDNMEKTKKEIDFISSIVEIDRFIVADLYMINFLSKYFPNIWINLSSLALFSNISHFSLFNDYKNIKRIIFHRDIDEDTIVSFIKFITTNNINVELEYFSMNERCYNIDWLCFSLHNVEDNIPFVCQRNWLYNNKIITKFMKERSNCQLCMLKNIKDKDIINIYDYIEYYKIPWRWHNNKIMSAYAKITKNILMNLSNKENVWFEIKKDIFIKNWNNLLNNNIVDNLFCWNCYYKNL